MGLYAYDVNGYVDDFGTATSWAHIAELMRKSKIPQLVSFGENGYAQFEQPQELVDSLEKLRGQVNLSEDDELTRQWLINLAKRSKATLIISDGSTNQREARMVSASEDRFPCISVRQPWADLILWGVKDIENRSKLTHFRGTILVHSSSATPEPEPLAQIETVAKKHGVIPRDRPYDPARGAILGMVDIVDCVTKSESEYFQGPYGWVLDKPIRFKKSIPFKGAVGIFYVSRAILSGTPAARKQAGQTHSR